MRTMVAIYEREERKQLALAYLAALEGRVSKLHYQIVKNEATSGYEFDAIESALSFAKRYGFEIPEKLTLRARELYRSEQCDPTTFESILTDQPTSPPLSR